MNGALMAVLGLATVLMLSKRAALPEEEEDYRLTVGGSGGAGNQWFGPAGDFIAADSADEDIGVASADEDIGVAPVAAVAAPGYTGRTASAPVVVQEPAGVLDVPVVVSLAGSNDTEPLYSSILAPVSGPARTSFFLTSASDLLSGWPAGRSGVPIVNDPEGIASGLTPAQLEFVARYEHGERNLAPLRPLDHI